MKRRTVLTTAILATAIAGCSSAGLAESEPACSTSSAEEPADAGFPSAAFMSVKSTSGGLCVALRSSPQPPARGIIAAEITVVTIDGGAPVDGLAVAMRPWMPAMNHGAVAPTITPEGGGRYRVANLDLFMAGLWQLKTSFSGPMSDDANPEFEVP